MNVIKLFYRITCFIKKNIYIVLYQSKISFGKRVHFRRGFSLMIDNTAKVAIGGDCFFNNDCSINSMGLIIIGEHCLFGENVKLYDHNHRYSDYEKNIDEQGYTVGTISLGSNCWIGSNVTILMNSHIGDHVIIGANCLIHKDIPSNSIVKNSLNSQVGVREINYTN